MSNNEKQINFVAIGDSISEGYSEYFQFGDSGEMKNNNISGTSWPSYLARYIKEAFPKSLNSYYNFALSSSRPEDWNYFLGVNKKEYSFNNSKVKLEYINLLNKNPKNKLSSKMKKYFNNFSFQDERDFEYLIKKIKKANLITFNIGANSIIPKIPYKILIEHYLKNDKESFIKTKNTFKKIINETWKEIDLMIKRLKELNNEADIVCVGYIAPFSPFYELLGNLFPLFTQEEKSFISSYFIEEMNSMLKDVSSHNNIIFIDIFDKKYWKKYSYKLNEVFYDIHPTVKGYKKIAQDVFSTLFSKTSKTLYLKDFVVDNEFIKRHIYGTNNELIWIDDEFEKESLNFQQMFFVEKSIKNKEFSNLAFNELKNGINVFLKLLNVEIDEKTNQELNKLFSNDEFINFIYESKIISKIFWNTQKDLNDEYNKGIYKNTDDFLNILIKNIFSINNFIYFIKAFVIFFGINDSKQNEFMLDFLSRVIVKCFENNRIKNSFLNVLQSLLNTNTEKIDLKIDVNILQNALNNIDINSKVSKFVNKIYFFTIKNISKIKKINDSKSLFEFYFLNNRESSDFFLIFKNILENTSNLDSELTKVFIKKLHLVNIKDEESIKKINLFLKISLNEIEKNNFLKEVVFQFFIESLIVEQSEINLSNIIKFLFSLDKKDFWKKIEKFEFSSFLKSKKNLNIFVDVINLFFEAQKYNPKLINSYLKIDITQTLKITNKKKQPLFIKKIVIADKSMCLIKPGQILFNSLYVEYIKTKNKNVLVDYENKFYKLMFRLLISSFMIGYELFQKDFSTNIFWPKTSLLFNSSFSVVKVISKFVINKNNSKEQNDFFLKMLGEDKNTKLNNNYSENSYNKNNILWYINSFEKTSIDHITKKEKIDIISNSLINGYWINNDE